MRGLPLHVQIDTYEDPRDGPVFHRGYCQIKVFCDKFSIPELLLVYSSSSSTVLTRLSVTPFQTHCFKDKFWKFQGYLKKAIANVMIEAAASPCRTSEGGSLLTISSNSSAPSGDLTSDVFGVPLNAERLSRCLVSFCQTTRPWVRVQGAQEGGFFRDCLCSDTFQTSADSQQLLDGMLRHNVERDVTSYVSICFNEHRANVMIEAAASPCRTSEGGSLLTISSNSSAPSGDLTSDVFGVPLNAERLSRCLVSFCQTTRPWVRVQGAQEGGFFRDCLCSDTFQTSADSQQLLDGMLRHNTVPAASNGEVVSHYEERGVTLKLDCFAYDGKIGVRIPVGSTEGLLSVQPFQYSWPERVSITLPIADLAQGEVAIKRVQLFPPLRKQPSITGLDSCPLNLLARRRRGCRRQMARSCVGGKMTRNRPLVKTCDWSGRVSWKGEEGVYKRHKEVEEKLRHSKEDGVTRDEMSCHVLH
uniref:(California timema) hypothetical protein n=1 Tax=Timema californicum TaxID=61474 RepID=A0A7R9IW64_TIMCA|nr:unnamed protein product [Timema californicum]